MGSCHGRRPRRVTLRTVLGRRPTDPSGAGLTSSHPWTGGIPSRWQSRGGGPPKATFPPRWWYSGLRAPLRPVFPRVWFAYPLPGYLLAATSRRRCDGTVVPPSCSLGWPQAGPSASPPFPVWCSGGKCGQARFLLTETPIQLHVSRLACHTIPCPMSKVWGLQASDPR